MTALTLLPSYQNATLTYDGQLFDVKHDLYILIQTDQKDDIEIRIIPIELIRKEPKKEEPELNEEDDESDDESAAVEQEKLLLEQPSNAI
jgi:hypothetical protein